MERGSVKLRDYPNFIILKRLAVYSFFINEHAIAHSLPQEIAEKIRKKISEALSFLFENIPELPNIDIVLLLEDCEYRGMLLQAMQNRRILYPLYWYAETVRNWFRRAARGHPVLAGEHNFHNRSVEEIYEMLLMRRKGNEMRR